MIKRYGRKFKNKGSVKRYITGRAKSWDPIIKSAPDKETRESCKRFKGFWKRELRKLK